MNSSLKDEDVETFLLSNSEFLENWLKKHGTPELMSRIKKIDVSDKKPKFSHAARNSITSNMFKNYVDGLVQRKKAKQISRQQLMAMSETDLFMELIRDIASELDVNVLCHKILRNVSVLTGSDRGSLFLVRGSKENKFLVSKLFDVTESSTLEESLHTEDNEIKVPFGKGIAGTVGLTKETIIIKDAYEVNYRNSIKRLSENYPGRAAWPRKSIFNLKAQNCFSLSRIDRFMLSAACYSNFEHKFCEILRKKNEL